MEGPGCKSGECAGRLLFQEQKGGLCGWSGVNRRGGHGAVRWEHGARGIRGRAEDPGYYCV